MQSAIKADQNNTVKPNSPAKIAGPRRAKALSTHFPNNVGVLFEQACFAFMDRFYPQYNGGYWDFFESINGAFFMALAQSKPQDIQIQIDSNEFESTMSTQAAGIVVGLFALSHLMNKAFSDEIVENLVNHYYALRDIASEHPECSVIFRAID